MAEQKEYKHLAPRYGSRYKQYFYKGRGLRAEAIYRRTVGNDPLTPEEVAEDLDIPVEAVHEAIHYCTHNEELLRQEREEDWAEMKQRGLDKPPHVPSHFTPES
jgi:hypothetical protein